MSEKGIDLIYDKDSQWASARSHAAVCDMESKMEPRNKQKYFQKLNEQKTQIFNGNCTRKSNTNPILFVQHSFTGDKHAKISLLQSNTFLVTELQPVERELGELWAITPRNSWLPDTLATITMDIKSFPLRMWNRKGLPGRICRNEIF